MRARMIGKRVFDPTFGMIIAWTFAAPLEQSEDRNLAASAASPFALAGAAEITLIDLHLAAKQLGRLLIQALSDHFQQFAEE